MPIKVVVDIEVEGMSMKLEYNKEKKLFYIDSLVKKTPERFLINDSGIKSLESIGVRKEDAVKRSHLLSLVQKGYAYPIEHKFEAEQLDMKLDLDQGEFDYLPRCEGTDSVYEISLFITQGQSGYQAHLYSPELVVINRKSATSIIPISVLNSTSLSRIVELYKLPAEDSAITNIKKWYACENAERWDAYRKQQYMKQGTFDFDEVSNNRLI